MFYRGSLGRLALLAKSATLKKYCIINKLNKPTFQILVLIYTGGLTVVPTHLRLRHAILQIISTNSSFVDLRHHIKNGYEDLEPCFLLS